MDEDELLDRDVQMLIQESCQKDRPLSASASASAWGSEALELALAIKEGKEKSWNEKGPSCDTNMLPSGLCSSRPGRKHAAFKSDI